MSQVIGKILMIPKGTYDATATYNILDLVRYGGKVWCCKLSNVSGVTPSESSTWTMLVQDGSSTGDMNKSEYDDNYDGVVNAADTAGTLTGLTATITQLNYLNTSTSDIQTQINGKISNPSTKTSGQILMYNGTDWIASNKENFLVQQHTLDTTATTCTFIDALITDSSTVDVYIDDGTGTYVSNSAITYDSITVTQGTGDTGICSIVFPAQESQSTIGVKIYIR